MNEIERKFLLNYLPGKASNGSGIQILQGYLWIGEKREARIRQYGKKYFLTLKDGSGLTRQEYEVPISKKQFDQLWPATEQLRIEKERHRIAWNGRTIEIDVFNGLLKGLRLAEVEFPDEETAISFTPPPWCGHEVTDDPLFRNQTLGAMGKEEIEEKLSVVITPPYKSIGAIPIIYLNDKPNYILVTTTGSGRWIFPKGTPEDDMRDPQVAQMEAFEEAGVEGEIFQEPLPVYYWKGYQGFVIEYYPLRVEKLLMTWEEMKQRERKICDFEEALRLLEEPSFTHALTELSKKL
ncbi:MAG: CYTH domain-containing protein [Chitinispirillaceae bacterium]